VARTAWIVSGGWEGHQPEQVSAWMAAALRDQGFTVEIFHSLECLTDREGLRTVDLLVPNWTMGQITDDQVAGLVQAVEAGTGLAGLHGGMGDAFRGAIAYQWVVGGQFMAHPGGQVPYTVHIVDRSHPITAGLDDFEVTTEQYYMLVDPANHVLATTQFGPVTMPVVWTKTFGKGRVFYCSLGHDLSIVTREPVATLLRRGLAFAARGDTA
jgi:type 1 glutamine amidotransferase